MFPGRDQFVIMRALSNLLLLLSIFQISFGKVSIQVDYVDALDSDNAVDSVVTLDSDNPVDSDTLLDSALESDPVYDDFVEESDEIEKKVNPTIPKASQIYMLQRFKD